MVDAVAEQQQRQPLELGLEQHARRLEAHRRARARLRHRLRLRAALGVRAALHVLLRAVRDELRVERRAHAPLLAPPRLRLALVRARSLSLARLGRRRRHRHREVVRDLLDRHEVAAAEGVPRALQRLLALGARLAARREQHLQHLHDLRVVEAGVAHVAHDGAREAPLRRLDGAAQLEPRDPVALGLVARAHVERVGGAAAARRLDGEAEAVEGRDLRGGGAPRVLHGVEPPHHLDELVKVERARAVDVDGLEEPLDLGL